jgi:hypothetical protein
MRSFKIYITSVLVFLSFNVISQEYARGISINEIVKKEYEENILNNNNIRNAEETDGIVLPFFDDFSTSKIYPDQMLWDGYSVFVSNDIAYQPTNTGAATLDAINGKGVVYKDASWSPFKADTLLSRNIRLDSIWSPLPRELTPSDSIYLSFFYQPQGVGDKPDLSDSLLLEFSVETGNLVFSRMDSIIVPVSIYMQSENDTIWPLDTLYAPPEQSCNPDVFTINYEILTWGDMVTLACDSVFEPEIVWNKVWYSEGLSMDEFIEVYGRSMMQVLIPITDTSYFKDNFRFRFRNYATVSNEYYPASWRSNTDYWNIDYVYLNHNRTKTDTTYRVLSFSERAPSFLKDYEVMPYRQYRYSPLTSSKTDIRLYITNLDDIEHNTQYSYHVDQVGTDFSFYYDGGSCNLKPYYEVGFQNCEGCGAAHACPPVSSLFSLDYDRDTTSYIIKHFISDSSDQNSIVDSLIYRQGFYNYYAYDDGTPEKSWGLDGSGGAEVAYKFSINMPDTLWGIQIYFNRTLNDANEFYFDLVVWNDNNGKPGERIYTLPNQRVSWEEGLYVFYPYMFDEPLVVSGNIYVGWEKLQKDNMNVGMDANNIHSDKIFYRVDADWQTSNIPGALLIRPMIGPNMILSTSENFEGTENDLVLYPNPASDYFKVDMRNIKNASKAQVSVYNLIGQKVISHSQIPDRISIADLKKGIYIVTIETGNKIYTSKLVVN